MFVKLAISWAVLFYALNNKHSPEMNWDFLKYILIPISVGIFLYFWLSKYLLKMPKIFTTLMLIEANHIHKYKNFAQMFGQILLNSLKNTWHLLHFIVLNNSCNHRLQSDIGQNAEKRKQQAKMKKKIIDNH